MNVIAIVLTLSIVISHGGCHDCEVMKISCPCGDTGKLVLNHVRCGFNDIDCQNCVPNADTFCYRFRYCETCKHNLTQCQSCPLGFEGEFCAFPNNEMKPEVHLATLKENEYYHVDVREEKKNEKSSIIDATSILTVTGQPIPKGNELLHEKSDADITRVARDRNAESYHGHESREGDVIHMLRHPRRSLKTRSAVTTSKDNDRDEKEEYRFDYPLLSNADDGAWEDDSDIFTLRRLRRSRKDGDHNEHPLLSDTEDDSRKGSDKHTLRRLKKSVKRRSAEANTKDYNHEKEEEEEYRFDYPLLSNADDGAWEDDSDIFTLRRLRRNEDGHSDQKGDYVHKPRRLQGIEPKKDYVFDYPNSSNDEHRTGYEEGAQKMLGHQGVFPYEVDLPSFRTMPELIIETGIDQKNERSIRETNHCEPKRMQTADVKCTVYSTEVRCRLKCIPGYTFENMIEKIITCYENNTWTSTGFEECFQRVDITETPTIQTDEEYNFENISDVTDLPDENATESEQIDYPVPVEDEPDDDIEIARFRIPRHFPFGLNYPLYRALNDLFRGPPSSQTTSRPKRVANVCVFPRKMETMEIRCAIYSTQVRCNVKCLLGYTFGKGNEKLIICRYDEGTWTPSGFEECYPETKSQQIGSLVTVQDWYQEDTEIARFRIPREPFVPLFLPFYRALFGMATKPPDSSDHSSHRPKRAVTNTCSYPEKMKTAEVRCIIYNMKVRCDIKCVWGHTFGKVNEKTITCRYEDGKWTPSGFEECTPYVNCSIELISAGDVHCVSNTIDEPQYCNVFCEDYDDQPAVSLTKYECQPDGSWDPPLPFCVQMRKAKPRNVAP